MYKITLQKFYLKNFYFLVSGNKGFLKGFTYQKQKTKHTLSTGSQINNSKKRLTRRNIYVTPKIYPTTEDLPCHPTTYLNYRNDLRRRRVESGHYDSNFFRSDYLRLSSPMVRFFTHNLYLILVIHTLKLDILDIPLLVW